MELYCLDSAQNMHWLENPFGYYITRVHKEIIVQLVELFQYPAMSGFVRDDVMLSPATMQCLLDLW